MEKENNKWTREQGELDKQRLLEVLKEISVSEEDLEWVSDKLDGIIDEKEKNETKGNISDNNFNNRLHL